MMDEIDALAQVMRKALHEDTRPDLTLVPWEYADDRAKNEWRVCAVAALDHLEKNPPQHT